MNRCDQEKRLTLFLLGDLPEREAAKFSRHLAGCAACQECARELSPVLQSLSYGLAKDNAKTPRFDLHHQLKLLSVPAESTHRVIDWMARSRPWLAAAACAVAVTGLSYFVLFSSMSRQYGWSGPRAQLGAAGAAQSHGFRWAAAISPGGGVEASHSPAKFAGTDVCCLEAVDADKRVPAEEASQTEAADPLDGCKDAKEASVANGLAMAGSAEMGGSVADLGTETPVDTGVTVDRELGREYAKLDNKGLKINTAVKSRLVRKGLYAGRAAGGRERALQEYDGEGGGMAGVEASAVASSPVARPSGRASRLMTARGDGAASGLAAEKPKTSLASLNKRESDTVTAGDEFSAPASAPQPAMQNMEAFVARANRHEWVEEAQQKTWDLHTDMYKNGMIEAALRQKYSNSAGSSERALDAQVISGSVDALHCAILTPTASRVLFGGGAVDQPCMDARMKAPADKLEAKAEKAQAAPPAEPAAPRLVVRRPALAFNPFVATTENHFSTFAIDVNTASYNLTRQAIRSGALPDPDTVRTEEILNAFDYGDAAPDRATFRVYVEGAPSAFGAPGLTLLRIGVKGKRLGREEQRPAMLTFLLDTSGSMAQPDRIGRARMALRLLLDQLAPADKLQIVSFDDKARVVLPPTPASRKKEILKAFDRLQCNGSTNLEDGMRRAYEQAAGAFVAGGENRVILISDGVANLGADNAQDILREVEAFRKQGVTCSAFGVGEGTYNDAMLEELANKGQGVYRFLDSDEEVKRVFVEDLAATLHNIATDVKIQVEWSAGAVRRFRQLGYERRALAAEQFRDDTVEAGEVGSGQAVTALYELDLTPAAKQAALGTVRVRYRRVDTGATEEIAQEITPDLIAPALNGTRPQFRLAAGAAAFAELLRGSPYVVREYADVTNLLRPVTQELSLDPRVKELLALVEAAEAMSK